MSYSGACMNRYHRPLAVMVSLIIGLLTFHDDGFGAPSTQSLTSPSSAPLTRLARGAPPAPEAYASASLREALLAKGVLTLLQEHHLRHRSLDDQTSEIAFDLF